MIRRWTLLGLLCTATACDSKGGYSREDLQNIPAPKFAATLVLIDRLPVQRAMVIVVRRVKDKPANLIAISEQHATPGALGAGIQALVRSRQIDGETVQRDTSIIVGVEMIPKSWVTSSLSGEAEKELEDLKRAPIQDIPGFGRARARVIQLAPARP